jgi:hypothetical protein
MIVIGQPPTVQSASRASGHAPITDRKYRDQPVTQTSAHARRRPGRYTGRYLPGIYSGEVGTCSRLVIIEMPSPIQIGGDARGRLPGC